ncbi:hypothetical protein C8C76_11540 [Halanaerobium saccharolyticum]|jgi:hypothetical protein|uniref:Uncharacterized protein n=1 Tax=Halanaerobium saccharolyticum TaxID=43595 RepID=A0A2T5RJE4_9FIRM|nr:hypothetical protein [Halanaerobium saccharolyticum]PTV98634.1 hypothetical protein C8C76_11540 [Halanaerobium saccharolyticum]
MLSLFVLVFEIFISLVINIQLYSMIWWITIIAFPLMMIIFRIILNPMQFFKKQTKQYLDIIYTFTMFIYLVIHAYTFYINIGAWYGALIGIIITYLFANLIPPNEWNRMEI